MARVASTGSSRCLSSARTTASRKPASRSGCSSERTVFTTSSRALRSSVRIFYPVGNNRLPIQTDVDRNLLKVRGGCRVVGTHRKLDGSRELAGRDRIHRGLVRRIGPGRDNNRVVNVGECFVL